MNKQELRIVYMGTPEFAVESLKALVEGGYNVVGVVTMPDKPIGRHGSQLSMSPVKQYALEQGLKVLQPEKLKSPDFLEELEALHADLQIVVAFRMLPEVVWSMPHLGTFNLHASLLPQYRGAAPINWAVINGETETGVTTFFLQHEIDTGEVIRQVRVPIADSDNVGIVHDKLMETGARLVTETVDRIIDAFPAEQQAQIKSQLSLVLKAVVSQRLVPDVKGGRLPVFEVMSVNPAIQNMIRDGRTHQIDNVIYGGSDKSMLSMDTELMRLVREGKISRETAVLYSANPDTLSKRL